MPGFAHIGNPVPFNLSRWYAVVALVPIGFIAFALGGLFDRFVTQRLLWQEAVLTKEFVQSLAQALPLEALLPAISPGVAAAPTSVH